MKNLRHRWHWIVPAFFLFWTCIGVVFALPLMDGDAGWRRPLLASLTNWWAWGAMTPLIVALDRRLPFGSAAAGRRLCAQLALGLAASALHVYLRALLAASLGAAPWSALADIHLLTRAAGEGMLWSMLVYGLIVGGWWAYQSHHRYAEAELRMERMERNYTEARLNALRLQLDPHFLFNTLNTISAQVQAEPKLARQMIEHLGDLLRLSLDPKSRDEFTLSDELDFLDLYLSIQKIRFGDKLRVTLDVAPEVRRAAVPSLFIQPLVENAIRHGISRRAAGGTVALSARRVDEMLEITVRDDGVGLPADWQQRPAGLGLRLTRERIAGFHPDGATQLTIANHPEGGAQVTLRFPLQLLENVDAAS
ncbi:sensor histidine kinase [Duganella aceris]|uniref:Sensor histidine kinase n=1 Tax=Duganella aceris TaxID=2703883 RepID=A0ABX0FNV0_9BURK|nr:histidine kinase [Duganella aceris]NGZ86167.1 sensor histidine kinase [Duganella aceris]